MATLLERSTAPQDSEARPTREQCIEEAGAVLARALKLYVPTAVAPAAAA